MSFNHNAPINRRDFLRLAGTSLGALAIPSSWFKLLPAKPEWPTLNLEDLPPTIQEILSLMPRISIDPAGNLVLYGQAGQASGRVPLSLTLWNREHSQVSDRLYTSVPWGIVLHWYGDREDFDHTITGYLRGFDSIREVAEGSTRTSAHFLVGDAVPNRSSDPDSTEIGIAQTQTADVDGTPFVASHIQALDYFAHRSRKQYFVRALHELGNDEPGVHSILQDWFDGGREIDPNMHTIAIEITGHDFESAKNYPSPQKIANLVALVWVLMKRYQIRAMDLFGHHEIQLNKGDPGKKFMTLIRHLIGIRALLEDDALMKRMVFGNFIYEDVNLVAAVERYFRFIHDYLLMVSTPQRTYEWEMASGYWHTYDRLVDSGLRVPVASNFTLPVTGEIASQGRIFTDPFNHEGIDLYRQLAKLNLPTAIVQPIDLIADGLCLFLGSQGEGGGCTTGNAAIFKHRQVDGGEVLSIYGHLKEIADLQMGQIYPMGYRVGEIASDSPRKDPFLHFAIAYGGTWKTDLSKHPLIPPNVGSSWITQRYTDPNEFILNKSLVSSESGSMDVQG